MKIFDFQKISENCQTQIFKINFRHEKIIFFDQVFSPFKVWLATLIRKQLPVSTERITMFKLKDKKVWTYFAV